MRFTARLKRTVNGVLGHYGYRVERIVDYQKHQLNVLELAVNALQPEDPDFFFIQVGAHDGRTGDPIRPFIERFGWRGLLLEPQPEVFKALTANYRHQQQLILVNVALAQSDGTVALYAIEGSSLRSSFNRDALVAHAGREKKITALPVRALTFSSLCRQYEIRRVDVLMIDTEGFDYQVVNMALAEGLRPRLIRYEHLHLSIADRNACARLLVDCGYRLLRDGIDTLALLGKPS